MGLLINMLTKNNIKTDFVSKNNLRCIEYNMIDKLNKDGLYLSKEHSFGKTSRDHSNHFSTELKVNGLETEKTNLSIYTSSKFYSDKNIRKTKIETDFVSDYNINNEKRNQYVIFKQTELKFNKVDIIKNTSSLDDVMNESLNIRKNNENNITIIQNKNDTDYIIHKDMTNSDLINNVINKLHIVEEDGFPDFLNILKNDMNYKNSHMSSLEEIKLRDI